jgi:uncharacterized membrane protein
MATSIEIKYSATTTNTPGTLANGELAVNAEDKKLWVGHGGVNTLIASPSVGIDDNATSTAITIDASENVVISSSGATAAFSIDQTGASTDGVLKVGDPDTLTNDTSIYMRTSGIGRIFTAGGDMHLDIGSTNVMSLDSAGDVGIGTTAPARKLHVISSEGSVGRLESSGTASLWEYQVSSSTTTRVYAGNDAGSFKVLTGSSSSERMRITPTGNVGIGTDTPTSELHVRGSTPQLSLQVTGDSQISRLQFLNTAGTVQGAVRYSMSDDSLQFNTAGEFSERMRIDSTGNVGIGTDTPTEPLDIAGDSIRIRTAQTPASASATGTVGQIAWDASYIYVCTATNTWKRTALATW